MTWPLEEDKALQYVGSDMSMAGSQGFLDAPGLGDTLVARSASPSSALWHGWQVSNEALGCLFHTGRAQQ